MCRYRIIGLLTIFLSAVVCCLVWPHEAVEKVARAQDDTGSHLTNIEDTWIGIITDDESETVAVRVVPLDVDEYWEIPCVKVGRGIWIAEYVRAHSTSINRWRIGTQVSHDSDKWRTYDVQCEQERFIVISDLEKVGVEARERTPGRGLYQHFWVLVNESDIKELAGKTIASLEYKPRGRWLSGSSVGWSAMVRAQDGNWIFEDLREGEFEPATIDIHLRATELAADGKSNVIEIGEKQLKVAYSSWQFQ